MSNSAPAGLENSVAAPVLQHSGPEYSLLLVPLLTLCSDEVYTSLAARFADCLPASGHALATAPYTDAENAPGKISAKLLAVPVSPVSPPRAFSLSHRRAKLAAMPGWARLAAHSAPHVGQAMLLPWPLAGTPFCLLAEREEHLRGLMNTPGLRMLEPKGSQVGQQLVGNTGNPGGTDIPLQNAKETGTGLSSHPAQPSTPCISAKPPSP